MASTKGAVRTDGMASFSTLGNSQYSFAKKITGSDGCIDTAAIGIRESGCITIDTNGKNAGTSAVSDIHKTNVTSAVRTE
jgi:hypothetical protein